MEANKDIILGALNEVKGKAIQAWGKLTEQDFTEFKGDFEELKGKVQKIYGYTRDQAEKEFQNFMDDLKQNTSTTLKGFTHKLNEMIDHWVASKKEEPPVTSEKTSPSSSVNASVN